MLISVSGVGASTARMMLSGMKPEEIIQAIAQGNTAQLEKIKGIGKKSAERLVVELRDKVGKHMGDKALSATGAVAQLPGQDAIQALVALGIARNAAEAAVQKTLKSLNTDVTLEDIIKQSLKNI